MTRRAGLSAEVWEKIITSPWQLWEPIPAGSPFIVRLVQRYKQADHVIGKLRLSRQSRSHASLHSSQRCRPQSWMKSPSAETPW